MSIIVDSGRYGYADIGIPPSSALDDFSFKTLNHLLGNPQGNPAIEVIGSSFSLKSGIDTTCAITGAKVKASVDDRNVTSWKPFPLKAGSTLKVKSITEGFRYYIGFCGMMDIEKTINSYTLNLECAFGGHFGRPLRKSDRISLLDSRIADMGALPDKYIPNLNPPHILRIVEGPEKDSFSAESLQRLFEKRGFSWYIVSSKSNRTGIRLDGEPLKFKNNVDKSIISEGVLPGTIQVPGDGLPIIMLHERTIGGYSRIGIVARADRDLLAHLKPSDRVAFKLIGADEAEEIWKTKLQNYANMLGHITE